MITSHTPPTHARTVHDDTALSHVPPCSLTPTHRSYTFLVYLSDVEAGGGTKFNDLDLVVEPK
jgi:hypothetical protein